MKMLPTPDDGFGVIGTVRTFEFHKLKWRAYEYRSPAHRNARPQVLIIECPDVSYELSTYPADWRAHSPAQLIALARAQAEDS